MAHVINGMIEDPFVLAAQIMKSMIYDWENVVDQQDNPIAFDKVLSVDSLPEKAIFEFVDKVVFPSLEGIIEFKKKISGEVDSEQPASVLDEDNQEEPDSKNS
jgi:hypothetical protein